MTISTEAGLQAAARGEAVLFLGAGFSFGASSVKGTPFVGGKELAKRVAEAVQLPEDTPLTLAADVFREEKGTDALLELIKPAFTTKTPVPTPHQRIASLPWRRAYTTNYDDLFEKASEANGIPLFSVTLSEKIQDIPKATRCCIHLNGYVGKLDRSAVDTELKLTDASYLHNAILDSEWAILLRQDLRLARAVFFIGYSLYDYEIRKLLVDIPNLNGKTFFVLGSKPNGALLKQIQQYGTALCETTEDFSARVKAAVDSAKSEAAEAVPPQYLALQEFNPPAESEKPKDRDQWRLFLQGVSELRHLQYSLSASDSFILRRSRTGDVLVGLQQGARAFAILSELGNGKTIFLQTLQFDLAAQGYRVFWITESGDTAERELRDLASTEGRKAFFLEGYADRLSLVETFSLHAHPDSAIFLTARTSVHDLFVDSLRDDLHGRPLVEFRLDVLDEKELQWFASLLTRYGMWGDRAGLSDKAKERYLSRDCQCQVQGILMKLLESPEIQQRLKKLFAPLSSQPKYQDVLICVMIVAVLGFSLTVDALEDVLGYEAISEPEFRKNPEIRQLVGFDSFL